MFIFKTRWEGKFEVHFLFPLVQRKHKDLSVPGIDKIWLHKKHTHATETICPQPSHQTSTKLNEHPTQIHFLPCLSFLATFNNPLPSREREPDGPRHVENLMSHKTVKVAQWFVRFLEKVCHFQECTALADCYQPCQSVAVECKRSPSSVRDSFWLTVSVLVEVRYRNKATGTKVMVSRRITRFCSIKIRSWPAFFHLERVVRFGSLQMVVFFGAWVNHYLKQLFLRIIIVTAVGKPLKGRFFGNKCENFRINVHLTSNE